MKTLKIFILLILIGAFFTNYAVAQFFVEVGNGYAMPMKKTKNSYQSIDFPFNDIRMAVIGAPLSNSINGLFFSGEAGYRFKNNFALSLNFQYLNNNKIRFLSSGLTGTNYYEEITEHQDARRIIKREALTIVSKTTSGRYFSFSPKFSYIFTIKNWEIQPAIGFSYTNTKMYSDIKTELNVTNTAYNHISPEKDTIYIIETITLPPYEYKYRAFRPYVFSAYFSLSLNYRFNKNISAFFLTEFNGLILFYFQGRPILGELYYQKYTRYDYNVPSIVENFNVIPDYGIVSFPRRVQKELYKPNYTNLNFSVGVRYTFNNRQKKD